LKEDPRKDTDLDISIGLSLMAFVLKGESIGLGSCILTAPLVFIEDGFITEIFYRPRQAGAHDSTVLL
jgi:hypothetical protein